MEAAAASLTAGLSAGLGPSASMPSTENESLVNSNETEVFVDLLDAAVEGNLGRVKSLLKIMDAGAASRLDFRRSQPTFGESPLHRAASVEVAKALVDHGVNVDLQGAVGQTPLHTLVSAPHVVRYLLKCGARVNAQTVDHSTPLHWAVVQDCAETVQILLRAGAKIDHQNDSGNAALHMVCSLDVARLLVSSGARLDLVNGDGQIPLEAAASKPDDDLHLQVASYLLDVSHSASLRASSSFNIFRPEFDIYGSLDPILQRQESMDMGSNNPASDVAAPVASSSLKQHQLERQLQERREREVELGIDTRTDVESGMPPPLLGHIDPLPPILERQDTKERINSTLKRVDARERWRLVRQRVLKGDLRENRSNRGAGGLGEMIRGPKRLRFASEVAQHARSASLASSWSDDGVTNLVQARTDEFYFRFFEVMVRDRPKLALRMLDRQRTFLYARGNDKIYSYDTLLTGGPVTSNEILDKMVQDERHELISHEVVQWIFNIRWILFTREALLFEFAVHCIFVAFFFATTLYGEEDLWHCFVQAQAFLTLGSGERRGVHATQAALELVVFALNVRHLIRFFIELGLRRGRDVNVYSDPFTDVLPHVCVLLEQLLRLTVSTHIDVTLFRDASNLVSAVGAVLLWIRLLSFAEGFEVIGITMCTIRRMLADIAIYLVVLLIYVTGFSHAITLIFRGSGSQLYGTMYDSWITLYFFVFNLDVGALNDEEKVFRKYSGYFFVGIYMVVVALVILNLIIAIMTNTFDEIQQNAKEQWLLQRARIILTYDLREKSLNKMYKMLCLRCRRCCGRTSDDYDVEDYLPELTRKNIVIEKGNGQVDVQVPAEWLHAVNLIRRKAPTYNSIRYTLFRRWKKLRRSPSFLWPELKETQSFFQEVEADEQRIAQQALNNEALHRRGTSISKSEADSETEGLDDEEDSVESEDLGAFNGVYPGNAVRREESAGLLHGRSSQQRGWGTFESEPRQKGLAPKAASVSASSYVSAESSVANNMKRRASSETSAMRTGVEEELVRIGYFQRNPKRIAADRVMQSAIHLQRAAPPPPYAAADLSSVSSRQDLQEDEHEFEASPPAPGSAVGGVSGLGGPGEHAFADVNSVGESTRYSSSAAAGVRRRAKSFKRHTSTLEGQIQQEVDDMNDAMALHGVVPGQASVMDDTMNLRNEAAIEHLTGLIVRLSEQVSALEGRIAVQQKADSPYSVSGSEH